MLAAHYKNELRPLHPVQPVVTGCTPGCAQQELRASQCPLPSQGLLNTCACADAAIGTQGCVKVAAD